MNTPKAHFISVIVPVYRKESIIVNHVRGLYKVLSKLRYPSEIIAVIDGRIDRSEEKLRKAAIPTVRILAYKKNQGKAYAIRHGMAKAKGDYVMFIDAGK
ncbi:MAG: glycosyltransferase, partial [Candidatus Roizmanbacteria bacterium]|nr:glycosyltransferase [Candidatus Roizmanbacteria bacterium]